MKFLRTMATLHRFFVSESRAGGWDHGVGRLNYSKAYLRFMFYSFCDYIWHPWIRELSE